MCVVSFIGDNFKDRMGNDDLWKRLLNPIPESSNPYNAPKQQPLTTSGIAIDFTLVTKREFEILKREVEQLKELLKGAIEYDKRNNEPHCEIDEKVALIKQIAKAFGIDVTDIFKDKTI